MSDARLRELQRYLETHQDDYSKWHDYLVLSARIGKFDPENWHSFLFFLAENFNINKLPEGFYYQLLHNIRNAIGHQLASKQLSNLFSKILTELDSLPPVIETNAFKEDEAGIVISGGFSVWYDEQYVAKHTAKQPHFGRRPEERPVLKNILDTTPQYILMKDIFYSGSYYHPPDWDSVNLAVSSDPFEIIKEYVLERERDQNQDALYDPRYEEEDYVEPTIQELMNSVVKALQEIFGRFNNPPEVTAHLNRIVVLSDEFGVDWDFSEKNISFFYAPFEPKNKNPKDFEWSLENVLAPFDEVWKRWLLERLNTIFKKYSNRTNPDESIRRKMRDAAAHKDFKTLNATKLAQYRATGILEPDCAEEHDSRRDIFPDYGIPTKKHKGAEVRIWNLGPDDEQLIIEAERRHSPNDYDPNFCRWRISAVRQYFIPERNLRQEDLLLDTYFRDSQTPPWNNRIIQKLIYEQLEKSLSRRNPDEQSRRKERDALANSGKLSDEAKLAMWRSGQPVPPVYSNLNTIGGWNLDNRVVVLYYTVDIEYPDYESNIYWITADLFYRGRPVADYIPIGTVYVEQNYPRTKEENKTREYKHIGKTYIRYTGSSPTPQELWYLPKIQEAVYKLLTAQSEESNSYLIRENEINAQVEKENRFLRGEIESRKNPDESSRRKERKALAETGKLSDEAKIAKWRSGQAVLPDFEGNSKTHSASGNTWELGNRALVLHYRLLPPLLTNKDTIDITGDLYYKGKLINVYIPIVTLDVEPLPIRAYPVLENVIKWDRPEIQTAVFNILTDSIYNDAEQMVDKEQQKKNPDDFNLFIKDVRKYIKENSEQLKQLAQNLIPEIRIRKVELTGSYAPNSKNKPREDSDIDLAIYYRGTLEPEEVAERLYNKLEGEGGTYDIVPIQEI